MAEPILNADEAVRVLGALPVPMGPGPQSPSILDRAREALGARMAKDDLRLVLENVINYAAGLEAERHSTNEALDDAAKQLRADRDRIAVLEARDTALLTVMERVRDMDASVTDVDGRPAKPGCSVWGLLSDLATVRGLNRAPEHNQWSGEPYPESAPAEDVTPQVTKLRALLAGQRMQTGGA